jgi:uncharacterized protein (TIGR03435 family)
VSRAAYLVLDRTGLSGTFDLDLEWTPASPTVSQAEEAADRPAAPSDQALSIFTAVQEQLGLKLASQRGPVDVVVIDHVEPPTED